MSVAPRPPEPGAEPPSDFPPADDSAKGAAHQNGPDLQNAHGRLFLDYWGIKCREGRLPGRQDIDPVEMRSFLAYVVLLDVERQPSGFGFRFRYRLVGTHVVEILGRELTGIYLDEVNPPHVYSAVGDQLTSVVQTCRPISGRHRLPARHPFYQRYEHVTVPLASDGFSVDMLLGVRCGLLEPKRRLEDMPVPAFF
jgi:hypothetical protein